jgi:hypothetical protein
LENEVNEVNEEVKRKKIGNTSRKEMPNIDPMVVARRVNDKFVLHHIYSFGVKSRDVLLRNAAVKAIQRWYRKYRLFDGDTYSGMIRTIFLEYSDEHVFNYPGFAVYKMRRLRNNLSQSRQPHEFIEFMDIMFQFKSEIRRWIMNNLNAHDLAYIGV